MRLFNIHRFASVARWDIAVNRGFYLRAALVIFIIMALPVISDISIWHAIDPIYLASSTIRNFIFLFPFLFGYMFHNLATKQGRINELTLPASNLEKFLWHTCLIVVGSLAVAIVSFFLIDLIYYISIGIISGFDNAQEFISAYIDPLGYTSGIVALISPINELSLPFLLFIVFGASIFVLGNAYKYRHNIPTTLLWLFILGIIATVVVPVTLFTFPSNEIIILDVWNVILLALIIICWTLAYHLYCHAAITSKRNH